MRLRTRNSQPQVLLRALLLILSLGLGSSWAQANAGAISGAVLDPLGARVPGARVTLVKGGARGNAAVANTSGEFSFEGIAEGRYRLEVEAAGFATKLTDTFYVGSTSSLDVVVSLQIGPLK